MKNLLLPIFVVFISSLTLVACVGGSNNINLAQYSMTDGVSSKTLSSFSCVNVKLYGVLNDGSIVVKTSDVELRPATNHRWNGKLSEQLALIMKDVMDRKDVGENVKAEIFVKDFSGAVSGDVCIDAFFKLSNNGQDFFSNSLIYNGKQKESGYPALVNELKKGWESLCEQAVLSY